MSDKYEIKVVTNGDPRGAEKVADSLNKVDKAAKDTAKASASAAKGMNEYGEAAQKGAAVGRIFSEVARGNLGALAQLGTVLKATGTAVKTSVIGIALIGVTALFNALPGLIARLKGAKEETEKVAESAKLLSAAFEKAASARGSALSKELAAITEEASGAAAALQRVLQLQKAVADAKGGENAEQRRFREDMELGGRYTTALDARDRTAAAASSLAADVFQLESSVAGDVAAREERKALERELQALKQEPSRLGGTRRAEFIRNRLASTDHINSPEALSVTEEQRKRLEQMRPLLTQANDAARKAEQNLLTVGQGVVGIRPDGRAIPDPMIATARGLEDRRAREAAGIAEPTSNITPGARMADLRGVISYAEKAGAKTGAELAKIMQEAVDRMQAAQVEKFREQLKTLQR